MVRAKVSLRIPIIRHTALVSCECNFLPRQLGLGPPPCGDDVGGTKGSHPRGANTVHGRDAADMIRDKEYIPFYYHS